LTAQQLAVLGTMDCYLWTSCKALCLLMALTTKLIPLLSILFPNSQTDYNTTANTSYQYLIFSVSVGRRESRFLGYVLTSIHFDNDN